jgi:hypothetical protein
VVRVVTQSRNHRCHNGWVRWANAVYVVSPVEQQSSRALAGGSTVLFVYRRVL